MHLHPASTHTHTHTLLPHSGLYYLALGYLQAGLHTSIVFMLNHPTNDLKSHHCYRFPFQGSKLKYCNLSVGGLSESAHRNICEGVDEAGLGRGNVKHSCNSSVQFSGSVVFDSL